MTLPSRFYLAAVAALATAVFAAAPASANRTQPRSTVTELPTLKTTGTFVEPDAGCFYAAKPRCYGLRFQRSAGFATLHGRTVVGDGETELDYSTNTQQPYWLVHQHGRCWTRSFVSVLERRFSPRNARKVIEKYQWDKNATVHGTRTRAWSVADDYKGSVVGHAVVMLPGKSGRGLQVTIAAAEPIHDPTARDYEAGRIGSLNACEALPASQLQRGLADAYRTALRTFDVVRTRVDR